MYLPTNRNFRYEGKTSIRRRIPSTLNTWIITGFSLDPLYGLGITASPKKIKVSKPLVVSCDLPPSVQVGEVIVIPVVVYNYMDKDISGEVTIHNQEQMFEFVEPSNSASANNKST